MKPFFIFDDIIIYNADCFTVLPTLKDADIIFLDPPYFSWKDKAGYEFDWGLAKVPLPDLRLLAHYSDLCLKQNGRVILFGTQPFLARAYQHFSKRFKFCFSLSVIKNTANPVVPADGRVLRRRHEEVWIMYKGSFVDAFPEFNISSVLYGDIPEHEKLPHPAQKSLTLTRTLLKAFGRPNELVIDPFAGTGTTLLAAKQLGLRAIGIEIVEEYCNIALSRLKAWQLAGLS